MATTVLKGKVHEVGKITQVGEKQTDLQQIILFVPGYHNGFEQVGRDSYWLIQVMGKKVAELSLSKNLEGSIIEAKCYLDSQYLSAKIDEKKGFYSVNVTLSSYTLIK